MSQKLYKRVMLKLSGELFGDDQSPIKPSSYETIANKLIAIKEKTDVELVVTVGGGNIFRGREKSSAMDDATADYMGMLGTIINGMGLKDALERLGVQTRLMSAIAINEVAEPYIRPRAIRHLEKGRIVILVAGLGRPFFTTDSGAAHRAAELKCEVIIKATNVDGVYSDDPRKNSHAKLYKKLTHSQALKKRLEVMDTTAFDLCRKHNISILVFNVNQLHLLDRIIQGERVGTLVTP